MQDLSSTEEKIEFPSPYEMEFADVVHWGGVVSSENLYRAYREGIFPWPTRNLPLPWCCPDPRAILDFGNMHLPKSLLRQWKNHPYRISVDEAFPEVIRACATVPRPDQEGTWITDDLHEGFLEFHRDGHAHSIEVWDGAELVGGLYGVAIGGAFSGESMFHLRSNTSKLALLHLVDLCRARGVDWIDIQMLTPLFVALGAREIRRETFLDRLHRTQGLGVELFDPVPDQPR